MSNVSISFNDQGSVCNIKGQCTPKTFRAQLAEVRRVLGGE